MSYYEALTFLHVTSAIIWLGAGFVIALLLVGAERAGDRAAAAGYHRDVGWLAPRLFIPASLATLILGVLLVLEGPWGFDQLWITVALTGWAITFGLGFFYFRPEGERLGAMVAERGVDDPELNRRLARIGFVDRAQVSLLFLIVADMVLKPTGDDTGLLIAGGVLAGLAALYAVRGVSSTSAAA